MKPSLRRVAIVVIPLGGRVVEGGVVGGLHTVLMFPSVGLSLPPEPVRSCQLLPSVDIQPDVFCPLVSVAAPVVVLPQIAGVRPTPLSLGAVEVFLHGEVCVPGVTDTHVRVEHVAGVLAAVEECRVRLEDTTRGLGGTDLLQTILSLRETREEPGLCLPVNQVRLEVSHTVGPGYHVLRAQSSGPSVEVRYSARETVGQLSTQALPVLAQPEPLQDVLDAEVVLLHVVHQVVLHVGHLPVVVKRD